MNLSSHSRPVDQPNTERINFSSPVMTDDFYSKPYRSAWDNNNVSSSPLDPTAATQSTFALTRSPNNYVMRNSNYNTQFRPPYNSEYRPVPSQQAQAPPPDTVTTAEKRWASI